MYSTVELQKLVQMLAYLGIIGPGSYPPHSVVLGGGANAAPGADGTLLASNGASADPSFQSLASLGIAPFPLPSNSVGASQLAASSVTDTSLIPGSMLYNRIYNGKTVTDYGAKGDGITDDSAAFQAAINSGICRIPYSASGYMIKTCLNATNLTNLTIVGIGYVGPQWGLAFAPPLAGSTLIANCGGFVLDITGSNNVTLRDFNISSMPAGLINPSVAGIVGGTSNSTANPLNEPGGSGYVFENIGVAIVNSGSSIPIYLNNANLGKFRNVNTQGKYGFVLTANNPLGATPVYTSFGTITASDGNLIDGLFANGYGDQPLLYLEDANDLTVVQSYLNYAGGVAGKPSYTGLGYALYVNNCTDVDIKAEVDNFPYMFRMDGTNIKVNISGITSPYSSSEDPAGSPIVGYFNGTIVEFCKFNVLPIGGYANANYHYATQGGGSPTMQAFVNCEFMFNTGNSANLAYLNTTNTYTAPFFNLNFIGNADVAVGAALSLNINGAAAAAANYRFYMNGKLQGTA